MRSCYKCKRDLAPEERAELVVFEEWDDRGSRFYCWAKKCRRALLEIQKSGDYWMIGDYDAMGYGRRLPE